MSKSLAKEILDTINGKAEHNNYWCDDEDVGKAKFDLVFGLQRVIDINGQKITLSLEESMIRSMFWKMEKYKDAQSLDKQKQLQSKIRRLEHEKENAYDRALRAERIINNYETYKYYNEGVDIDLAAMAKAEKEKYLKKRKNK